MISPATFELVCRPGGRGPKKKKKKKPKLKPGAPPRDTPSGAIVSPNCASVSFEDGVGDTFWNVVTGQVEGTAGQGDIVRDIINEGFTQPMDVVQELMRTMLEAGAIQMNCFTPQSFPAGNAGDRLAIERQRLIFMREYPQVYNWFADLANRIDVGYFNGNRWIGVNRQNAITRFSEQAEATLEPIIMAAMAMTNAGDQAGLDFVRENIVRQRAVFGPDNPMNWNVAEVSRQWWLTLNSGGAALDAMSPGLGRFFIERVPFVFQGEVVYEAVDRKFTNQNITNRKAFDRVVAIANYEAYQTVQNA